jgi:hypothetical protein
MVHHASSSLAPTIISAQQPLSESYISFPTHDMDNQSGPIRVHKLFESALQAYEKKTGVALAEHPLAIKLQCYDSVESITTLLQGQAQAFSESRGSDRAMKFIKNTVSSLSKLSATACLAIDIGLLVCQRALMICVTALTAFTAIPACKSNTC